MIKPNEISDILKQQLDEVESKVSFEEVGTVLEVGDGVAHVFGLDNVSSSELVEFENGVRGVAMNLEESNVGVILMGSRQQYRKGEHDRAAYRENRFNTCRRWSHRPCHQHIGRPHRRSRSHCRRHDYLASRPEGSRSYFPSAGK